ncbi:hypothetical protein LTR08_005425 [Meristemomyces frigidus]|nr:hypothetical protein LTR08_005425 [Meristemomyces frigidus]
MLIHPLEACLRSFAITYGRWFSQSGSPFTYTDTPEGAAQNLTRHQISPSNAPIFRGNPACARALALLRTCKQIAIESGRLFYIHNRFLLYPNQYGEHPSGWRESPHVLVPQTVYLLHNFMTQIGPGNAAVVRNVKIDLGRVARRDCANYRKDTSLNMVFHLCCLEQYAAKNPHWGLRGTVDLDLHHRRSAGEAQCDVFKCTVRLGVPERSFTKKLVHVVDEEHRLLAIAYAAMFRSWVKMMDNLKEELGQSVSRPELGEFAGWVVR